MKVKSVVIPVLAAASFLSVVLASVAGVERPYAFRAELETVHERGIRDRSVVCAADEFAFADGAAVSVPACSGLVFRAAQDFADYLAVSQGVSVRVAVGETGAALTVGLDGTLGARAYVVRVEKSGVAVTAADERAAAQALYHLEDLMNLSRSPFLRCGTERRRSKYSPRMIHSGWGIDTFPENYLRRAAHHGFDAILVFVKEAGRTARGWDDVNSIIRTAKRWGIDTYLYSYVHAPVHPDDPKAESVFRNSYGAIARAYPEARGYVFVGESCHFPSKDPRTNGKAWPDEPEPGDDRPYPGSFPCSDYPDWFKGVKAAIDRESPGADIVFWTYNFGNKPEDARLELIRKMPRDISLLVTFEMYENSVKRNGMRSRVWDYSLSDPGPGRYYLSEAAECGRLGLRHYTMANTAGLTWDMGTVPYLPCPFQWKKRWDRLEESRCERGLGGLMESHHYGWYPSFITELSKESFTEGGMPFEEHLHRIAARDFGEENAGDAVAAWKGLSEAIADSYPCPQNLAGPYRIGPAFPYNFGGRRIEYEDVPFPRASAYVAHYCWTYFNYMEDFAKRRVPPVVKSDWEPDQMRLEVALLADMVRKSDAAADAFLAIARKSDGRRADKARRMAGLARYMARTWTTVSHLRQGALATLKGDDEEVRRIAIEEYENKRAALELVDGDSRLGWEPSMDYMGGRDVIEWSMRLMERTYEGALPKARTRVDGRWAFDNIGGKGAWLGLDAFEDTGIVEMLLLGGSPTAERPVRNADGSYTITKTWIYDGHDDWNVFRQLTFWPTNGACMNCTFAQSRGGRKPDFRPERYVARRIPDVGPAPELQRIRYGEPVDLLKDGLAGWVPKERDRRSCWTFKDGVLENAGSGANLLTKRTDFMDFRISFDARVDKDCNSGVFLRGVYELQICDSFGKSSNSHNMAALYGRIAPAVPAEKPAGEWQHVDAILCDRHLTVTLNDVRIIDNQPVLGMTGSAITGNEFVPGPIYLQGDHKGGAYRNMVLTPILK